jgi:hypothetical protein
MIASGTIAKGLCMTDLGCLAAATLDDKSSQNIFPKGIA